MISCNALFCDECGAANTSEASKCFACKQPLLVSPVWLPVLPVGQQGALAPPAGADPLPPGFLLVQRYRIISQVGQGGFGVVYKARDRNQKNRLVAIKQINLGTLCPREIIEATDSYNREVTLLSTLRHPNLPRVYDHFTDPEHWYLVMDFIRGETLENYLARRGRLSVRQALNVGITLSMVLAYLHTRNPPVIFRDVKPANIMRTPRGHLYLIDFGIARRFTPGKKQDTGPLGSPGYAAPEQYGKAQTTMQADIYGLGATLQTLLTGQDPLERLCGLPPSTHHQIQPNLQALLGQMLERDANKRPLSMGEVKERLQLIRAGVRMIEYRLLAYANGLLAGSFPCALMLLLIFLVALLLNHGFLSAVFLSGGISFVLILTVMLLFSSAAKVLVAMDSLLLPGKRLRGLGMLTMLVLLFVLLLQVDMKALIHHLPTIPVNEMH